MIYFDLEYSFSEQKLETQLFEVPEKFSLTVMIISGLTKKNIRSSLNRLNPHF